MANPTEPLGWQGKAVKNVDGRTGKIASEWAGFLHIALTIAVDGGTEAFVQLNSDSNDTGEQGWAWHCPSFNQGPAWLPLGDHNTFGVVIDTPKSAVKLSEPQKLLIQSLRDGAKLHHHLDTGLFRLRGRFTTRSVHPSTVQSLLKMGMLNKTLSGDCTLV